MKQFLQFLVFTITLFCIHKWVVLPQLNVSETIPVVYQHLLFGVISVIIYFVTQFIATHFFSIVAYTVLGFFLLKMIAVAVFINVYATEIASQPIQKYILVALYFMYMVFLLVKLVPLINISFEKKDS